MAALPTGTVTFLWTDIKGSTRRWEEQPEAMSSDLRRHDELLRKTIESCAGHVFKTTGDGTLAVFADATNGVNAAVEAQRALAGTIPFTVRMALHTGTAEERDGDYFGPTLNRAARLCAIGHGGQVLLSAATAGLIADALPPKVSLLDLGEHGLRDLTRPEHVWQVVHPELAPSFPPLRSVTKARTNLVAQLTSFIGRESELERLRTALAEHRLTTVTGTGGVGKTRLALQAAANTLDDFPDGVFVCELALATDSEAMIRAIALALRIDQLPGMSLDDTIAEVLGERHTLIVLDNCEHLLEPCARFVDQLVRACTNVRVLATSREALDIDGEYAMRLRSLAVAPSNDVESIRQSDAIRLFCDRAETARAGATSDDRALPTVRNICARLDGIPLAIELAAARVVSMDVVEIDGLLDERFRLLTGGRRVALERHQTLRAAVDWSFELLTPVEKLVFARCSVFVGTFDAAAVIAVVAYDGVTEWEARDAIEGLVRKSILLADATVSAGTRYSLLETMRQYGLERLDDVDALRERHSRYYGELAVSYCDRLQGPDELRWREPLSFEVDNLGAASRWAIEQRDAALALKFVALEVSEQPFIGFILDVATGVLAFVDVLEPNERAVVYGAAGLEAYGRGDFERAIELVEASLHEILASGEQIPGMHLWVSPGWAGPELSQRITETALARPDLYEHTSLTTTQQARLYSGLISHSLQSGDFDTARKFLARSEPLAEQSQNPSTLAQVRFARAQVNERDDPDAALVDLEAVLAWAEKGARATGWAAAGYQSALIYAKRGDEAHARDRLRGSLAGLSTRGRNPELDGAFGYAIEILAELGECEAALTLVGAVLGGALQNLRDVPLPAARSLPNIRKMRDDIGPERFAAAIERGKRMSYDELGNWLLGVLDDDQM